MVLLEVENLSKVFVSPAGTEVKALEAVSLSVEQGETVGLVGGSGSGKSTLALCILRLIEPTSGSIRFKGEDWLSLGGKALRAKRRLVQPVFQDPFGTLNPLFRVDRIIAEPLLVHRMEDKHRRMERVRHLVEQVGLGEDRLKRLPAELSGGERQRVAIARALAPGPELLIADEPVSALDARTQSQIIALLTKLKAELGLTTLFISHELALVSSMCDRVIVIWRGNIVEVAGNKELFDNPLHPYTQALVGAARGELLDPALPAVSGELREASPGHWAAL